MSPTFYFYPAQSIAFTPTHTPTPTPKNFNYITPIIRYIILTHPNTEAFVIDKEGFRANVGIIVTNSKGQLLWARRCNSQHAWQFPQGGISENETPLDAMYRELKEELGLDREVVKLLAESRRWLRYRLPKRFQRHDTQSDSPKCIGQKQKWFLLELMGDDACVKLDVCDHPEFDTWKWVSYWFPLKQVIFFKRSVYRRALEEFQTCMPKGNEP